MAEVIPGRDVPPRRRETWSLKTLVEDIAGRPITEFQDPARPVHPYLKVKMGPSASAAYPAASAVGRGAELPTPPGPDDDGGNEPDPVDRVYPPLAGETGRRLHGPAGEHHRPTLETVVHAPDPATPGRRAHGPGPSQRPERVYLHYLLLHLDRLHESGLRYLRNAVDEELRHRAAPELSAVAAREAPGPDS